MLRTLSTIALASSLALGLSLGVPSESVAQDKPAHKTAPKKAGKTKNRAARKTKTATRQDAGVNVKKSLAHTDTLIQRARRAQKKKNQSKVLLETAQAHQKAASQAHKKGDTPSSVHLTLEARRLAREVITSNGQVVPKNFASNLKTETRIASPAKAGTYLASDTSSPATKRDQAPPARKSVIENTDDDMDMDDDMGDF